MAIVRYLALIIFLVSFLISRAQPGMTGILDEEQDRIKANPKDFEYEVQLLPGQEFSGYIYHWTSGDESWGELHEDPEVDWLEVYPTTFVANGCENPVPVRFTFKAPAKTGKYRTTVVDWEYNWSDNLITMNVTEHPTYKMTDSLVIFYGPDTSCTRYQDHEYHGIDPAQSWFDDGYCGDTPYIVNPYRTITHFIYPPTDLIKIEPDSISLHLFEEKTITKLIHSTDVYQDSFYEAVSLKWLSDPRYIKWKIVRMDLCCPPPEPVLTVQVYPNPLRDEAVFYVDIPYDSKVVLQLFDPAGRLILTLENAYLTANKYEFSIDGAILAEGLYISRLQTDREKIVRKLVKVYDW
jgi:hypothetical protein